MAVEKNNKIKNPSQTRVFTFSCVSTRLTIITNIINKLVIVIMKQASLSSFFIKRSATASNDLLPPTKKIKGDINPSPSPSPSSTTPSKKDKELKKIEEEEEAVSTPPIPSSPPQHHHQVKFSDSDSGQETEEDEDAQEHGLLIY